MILGFYLLLGQNFYLFYWWNFSNNDIDRIYWLSNVIFHIFLWYSNVGNKGREKFESRVEGPKWEGVGRLEREEEEETGWTLVEDKEDRGPKRKNMGWVQWEEGCLLGSEAQVWLHLVAAQGEE